MRDLDGLEAMMRDVAESILELCSEDVDLASSLPSVRAVAAITLARMSLHVAPAWSPLLEAVSGYTYADVQPCLMAAMRYDRAGEYWARQGRVHWSDPALNFCLLVFL